jgi:hypothetical protein
MTKAMYVHQWDQLAEKTLEAFAATCVAGGVTEVRPKAAQWLTWTGRFDAGGAADVTGMAELRRVREVLGRQGLRVVPWVVPMGLDVEAEAELHAAIGRECGALDLDVEPYAEFWPGIAKGDYSAVQPYFARLRQLVGDSVRLDLDFPARSSSWEWGRMREVVRLAAPWVDRLLLQSYFGAAQAADAEQRVRALVGDRPVEHIADVAHLQEMLGWLAGRPVWIWHAPAMNALVYRALGEYRVSTASAPPEPSPAPSRYVVGEGIATAMAERGDTPAGDEGPPGAPLRWAAGQSGRIYWYTEAANRVAISEPSVISHQPSAEARWWSPC